MKTLKYIENLVPLILSGEKDTTWRLFDDKDLQTGDEIEFLVAETKSSFAKAKLIKVKETTFRELTDEDWSGHEKFNSNKEMLRHYSELYKTEVTYDTPLKVIWFELIP